MRRRLYGFIALHLAKAARWPADVAEWFLKRHARACGCADCREYLVMRAIGPLLERHGRSVAAAGGVGASVERRPS